MHGAARSLPIESQTEELRNWDFSVRGIYQNQRHNKNEGLRESSTHPDPTQKHHGQQENRFFQDSQTKRFAAPVGSEKYLNCTRLRSPAAPRGAPCLH